MKKLKSPEFVVTVKDSEIVISEIKIDYAAHLLTLKINDEVDGYVHAWLQEILRGKIPPINVTVLAEGSPQYSMCFSEMSVIGHEFILGNNTGQPFHTLEVAYDEYKYKNLKFDNIDWLKT